MTDLRNELIKIENIDYIVEIELDVTVSELISTPRTECAVQAETFDYCVENIIQMDQCLLNIWNQPSVNYKSVCKNHSGILEVMNMIQTSSNRCVAPSKQVKVKMLFNPVNWLNVINNPIKSNTFTPGYVIRIPSFVLYSEMTESYTLISFIAEFGGWVGLFLGVSILGGFEFVENQLCSSIHFRFTKKMFSKSGLILKMASSLGVLIIVVQCGFKLINTEKSTDVKIVEKFNNVSISLCSVENIYQIRPNDTNLYYMGNSTSFWNNITRLSNNLERIEFVLENGNSVTIYDSSWDNGSQYIQYSINTPKFDTFIETCHTLDLKHWNRIKKMEVFAKKELTIYIHITGQLLRSGRQGFSFINKDTTTISNFG